jgi:hypothetical protein
LWVQDFVAQVSHKPVNLLVKTPVAERLAFNQCVLLPVMLHFDFGAFENQVTVNPVLFSVAINGIRELFYSEVFWGEINATAVLLGHKDFRQ